MSTATVNFKGVEIEVVYLQDGRFLPATEHEPAEFPVAVIRSMSIGGQDVTRLLLDQEDEIAARIEAQWRRT